MHVQSASNAVFTDLIADPYTIFFLTTRALSCFLTGCFLPVQLRASGSTRVRSSVRAELRNTVNTIDSILKSTGGILVKLKPLMHYIWDRNESFIFGGQKVKVQGHGVIKNTIRNITLGKHTCTSTTLGVSHRVKGFCTSEL